MNNSGATTLGIIFILFVFLTGAIVNDIVNYNEEKFYNETMEKVEECQKTLPRNVECVIVAVPEDDVED